MVSSERSDARFGARSGFGSMNLKEAACAAEKCFPAVVGRHAQPLSVEQRERQERDKAMLLRFLVGQQANGRIY